MATEFPQLDLDASLSRLSNWLSERRSACYDFAEDTRRYRGLADMLRGVAARLDGAEWFYLESEFDKDPPPEVGIDGGSIPFAGNNAGRYKILRGQLKELAETTDRLANGNPNPRSKPELPMAADFFLHLWLAAGCDKPSLYDKGPAVLKLQEVLRGAGYQLSGERVRGLLSAALEQFDAFYCIDRWQLDRLMVWRQ